MADSFSIFEYNGEGLERSYVNEAWMVGVKNYKPASDARNMDCLERHLLTDELFIPVTEGNHIVTLNADGSLDIQPMEAGKIYCVNQGRWHNVLMTAGSKIILVERPDTGMENSETLPLNVRQREQLNGWNRT